MIEKKAEAQLRAGLAQLALSVPDDVIDKLMAFLALLQRWNAVYNLTSIIDLEDMVLLHVLDSLAVLPWVRGTRMLDVGTGAGFPGIPWALVHPEWSMVLLDSNGKKIRFLNEVIRSFGLTSVKTVHSRLEDYADEEGFDTVVTRAVGNVSESWVHVAPLLRVGGCFLGMKGQDPAGECRALLSARWQIAPVNVPGLSANRHVVILETAEK